MNNFMNNNTPTTELNRRMHAFRQIMDEQQPEWKMAMIFSKINVFILGTMTEGVLVIQRDKDAVFWARRTYERVILESNFEGIFAYAKYRNAVQTYTTYL